MKNLFDLSGKVALITGSSSGMGKAIAEIFGLYGAKIVISSNDKAACETVVTEFLTQGIDSFSIPCDVENRVEIELLYQTTMAHFGKIDILVCCVGVAIAGSFLAINAENFDKTMQINVQSNIYLTSLVLPQMQARKDGSILYLASIAGVRGNKQLGLYGISKASLAQLARNLAVEFGPDNIRVNAISPGVIDTHFAKPLTSNESIIEKRLLLTPLRRIGKVEEIAGVALMLVSKAGGFITGQNIIVDGGTTISDGN
jgi:NAD(P)-dependent dehydrogenase (short-subunit alcohol dehydrogenase family)